MGRWIKPCASPGLDEVGPYTFSIPMPTLVALGGVVSSSAESPYFDIQHGLWVFDFYRSAPLETETPCTITIDADDLDVTQGYWPCSTVAHNVVDRRLPLPYGCVTTLELDMGCPNCAIAGWVHFRLDYIGQNEPGGETGHVDERYPGWLNPNGAYTFTVHGIRL